MRLPSIRHTLALFGVTAVLLAPAIPIDASAQDQTEAQKKLQELEAEIEARRKRQAELEANSKAAMSEAERLSRQLVELARDIRIAEENATRLESRIVDLELEEAGKKEELASKQDELLELLSALERLSRRPPALALLQPREALQTARSASLMGTIVPDVNQKADTLKKDLAALTMIQRDLSEQRFQLKNTLERLTDNQLKVGSLVKRRRAEARKASEGAEQAARELQAFAEEAADLKELIEKLARAAAKRAQSRANLAKPDRPRPEYSPTGRPIGDLKGALPYPVSGQVIQRFGARQAVGSAQGIQIKTRAEAQVVAPYDGRIVFAGPFKSYGQLLIIEHGDGYHSLLAGFGELFGAVGQWVLTGEPVGVMAPEKRLSPLYMELRHSGRAINPEPWLNRQFAASQ